MGPPPATAAVRLAVRRCLAEVSGRDGGTPGAPLVLLACSGGPDSTALAAAAAHEAHRLGMRAGAVTVDHGLQEGSGERAAGVADLLRGLGLAPVEVVRVEVGSAGGPEAAARAARYAALDAAADRLGAAVVLLGHTRDDQAESVLLGLARGSGARSLSGMGAAVGRLRRPLLHLPREVVARAAEESGLPVWLDPHNGDPAYARARVRSSALPVLEEVLGPGVAAALARTGDLLRDDADALDALAAEALTRCRAADGGLEVPGLAGLVPAVRRRVLRAWAVEGGCPAGSLSAGHVEAVDALVTGWRGQRGVDLPGGRRATRTAGVLRLGPARLATIMEKSGSGTLQSPTTP